MLLQLEVVGRLIHAHTHTSSRGNIRSDSHLGPSPIIYQNNSFRSYHKTYIRTLTLTDLTLMFTSYTSQVRNGFPDVEMSRFNTALLRYFYKVILYINLSCWAKYVSQSHKIFLPPQGSCYFYS